NWYVSDSTDNNTGLREVYAFVQHLDRDEYATLRMRCSKGKPTIFVKWQDVPFADYSVITIAVAKSPDSEPAEGRYVFEKSEDPVENGMRASPEASAKIISAIGQAKYVVL